jgi:hypothetical protein
MYTYGIERLKRFRITSIVEVNPRFNKQPRNPEEIIFIWHHNIEDPTNYVGRKNGPDNMSFYNHFSLLEPTVDTEIVAELVLPHENDENLLVDLFKSYRTGHVPAATWAGLSTLQPASWSFTYL